MIEIIKQGVLNRSVANCSHCGCQFYYDESDTQPTLGLTYMAARHVNCPCCHFEIQVSYQTELSNSSNPWFYGEAERDV